MTRHDDQPAPDRERHEFAEEKESLWRITFAPSAWALHFVACYGAVSLACEKASFLILPTRLALLAATLGVLAFIAWIGWRSFRQWDVMGTGEFSNPAGDAEDRHQFLGHAAFLLAVISFIGTCYTALPLLLLRTCQ